MAASTVTAAVFQHSGLVGLSIAVVGLVALYFHLLPKPIKSIPYNVSATRSLLGDIPALLKQNDSNVYAWMGEQAHKFASPVCQLFIVPFGKPMVYISDFHEAQDILMRRKEFDRSDYSIDLLGGAAEHHHISLKTGPAWKAHRRLIMDLMTPKFLNNVAGKKIYGSVCQLTTLWQMKANFADGKPFAADRDIYYTALDAVLDFTFGEDFTKRALPPQANLVGGLRSAEPTEIGTVAFPPAAVDDALDAVLQSAEAIGEVANGTFTSLAWKLKKMTPKERRYRKTRHDFLRKQVEISMTRLQETNKDDVDETWIGSAKDLMMRREQIFAEKDGREPSFWNETIHDEILGFLIAGHDTTSTTLCWAVKFLADKQAQQKLLREALQAAHPEALRYGRFPTYEEILKANIPYLDAWIEEVLRLAHTIPLLERQCTEDTVVLGHHIPKGTIVLIPVLGPSLTEPGFDIPDSSRAEGSLKAIKTHKRTWEEDTMGDFRPERWLVEGEDGEPAYDATAGPTLAFGLGLRGCYGKKLAYLEMKLAVTLLVWNFEFLQCPEELSGYKGVEGLTRSPLDCNVRLRSVR